MTSGLPSPNGASRSSSCASSSVSAERGHDRVDRRHGLEVGVAELAVRVRSANASAKASSCAGLDREPGGGAVPAEAHEMRRRRRRRPPWRSKLGTDRPEPFHSSPLAGDQHDRAVEALDEPGGDDPDHALVPALAPDHVAVPLPLRLRPALDDRDGLAENPLLDHLPVAIELLELVREQVGLARVLGEQQLERHVGPPEPARRR